ncbi:MAG: D-alanyl-D-alanine carboxypeptidase/D-alanyl-D-alanine-endopeptidase [Rhodothermaceae bacterium]|nr:D-alanyl-D-alanine carboxypeptidase/D-alanyl-D-alanine-endopeptidase [Rhodothermaceae bacterium]
MKLPTFLSSKYSWTLLLVLLMVPVNMGTKRIVTIGERIEAILEDPRAASAFWGVYVKDLSTNQVLYSRNSDKTLVPASNQKILTAAAALDILGADYKYETTLHFNGEIGGTVMRGDLILEGSGDPTFASKELNAPNPMKEWAEKLHSLGVTRLEGRLIGDDNVFDDEPYAEGWDLSFIANESFAPASSGLASHDNVVVVKIESSRVGAPPVLTDTPPGYLNIRNEATTSARRRGRSIRVNRTLGTEDIVIKGSIPRVYRRSVVIPVSNPTRSTLHALKFYLEEAGITVDAGLFDIDELTENIDYRDASPLFVNHSVPMSDILTQINKESDNLYAEQVFRTFGWGGSTDGGEKRVKDFFNKAGIYQAGLSVRDGSGLSRKNMISPETIGELLAYMHTHPQKEAFFSSFPRGGEAETTLDYRLKGVPVWAKTGSLEYVRTLSGYVRTADGRMMAFSLLANNYTVPSYRITQAMDRIVLAMTESTDV